MERTLEPEYLDVLNPADPRAERSRRELRFINFMMGNAGCVAHALSALEEGALIADLGGGDGTLLLRVARSLARPPREVSVFVVDRTATLSPATVAGFESLGWQARAVNAEAIGWLGRVYTRFDAIVANLFLHHFEEAALKRLFRRAAVRTNLFVACEPRRSPVALTASRSLWLAGCSAETRHDALVSVRAGFSDGELSRLWPVKGWSVRERPAGLFSHLFIASRIEAAP